MDNQPSFESSQDKFLRKPSYAPKIMDKPQSFIQTFFSKRVVEVKKEKTVPELRNIFGRRKAGATNYELKQAFTKASHGANLSSKEGVAVAEEFKKNYTSEKDVEKYLKELPYRVYQAPYGEDKSDPSIKTKSNLTHEGKLLKIVQEDKK